MEKEPGRARKELGVWEIKGIQEGEGEPGRERCRDLRGKKWGVLVKGWKDGEISKKSSRC